jgi:spore maturation protein CgeB
MKFLLGYSYYRNPVDVKSWVEGWLGRLRSSGIQVDGFPLTLNPPGPRLGWQELDTRWHRGDRELLSMYENLARRLEDYDVFVNWNGINLHPDFVHQLPTSNVYGCFDDPESSDDLSRPVAWAYDLCMIGNIAELETYRGWGVKQVRFWPMGYRFNDYDPCLTRERILSGERDVDVTLLCERTSPWRRERLVRFSSAFPQGVYYGNGWPNGFLAEERRVGLLQRTKIGINIHNSTGPINFRTYILPANGIMQICDNKSHLGEIFALGKEVIGFDTIEEAIDLTRYYLAHDNDCREIAAAGWERALKYYNEVATFRLVEKYVNEISTETPINRPDCNVSAFLTNHRRHSFFKRIVFMLALPINLLKRLTRRLTKAS